jgi:cytochrome c553
MFKTILATTVVTLALSTSAIANDQGKAKYPTCIGCHGVNAEGGIGPKLVGQTANEIVEKLIAYRNKEQRGPQSAMMWGIAASLTDEDIQALAEYLSNK